MGGMVEGSVLAGTRTLTVSVNYGRRFGLKTKDEAIAKVMNEMGNLAADGYGLLPIYHYPDRRSRRDDKPEEIPFTTTNTGGTQ